jgi:hypothetical protein
VNENVKGVLKRADCTLHANSCTLRALKQFEQRGMYTHDAVCNTSDVTKHYILITDR